MSGTRENVADEGYTADEQAIIDAGQREAPEQPERRDRQDRGGQREEREDGGEQGGDGEGERRGGPDNAIAAFRKRAEAAEAAVQQERRSREEFERRTSERIDRLLSSQREQPKPDTPALPDIDQDPVGHLTGRLAAQEAEAKRLREWAAGQQGQAQRVQEENALFAGVQPDEERFRQSNPDYNDAVQHLAKNRTQELITLGATPQQASELLRNNLVEIIRAARSTGKNPAQMVYDIAKSRGYQAKAATGGEGDAPDREAERIDRAADGQRFQASNGGGGGSAPRKGPTADEVMRMSDAEFDKFAQTPAYRRMYGEE